MCNTPLYYTCYAYTIVPLLRDCHKGPIKGSRSKEVVSHMRGKIPISAADIAVDIGISSYDMCVD